MMFLPARKVSARMDGRKLMVLAAACFVFLQWRRLRARAWHPAVSLPKATNVTSAKTVEAGKFVLPGVPAGAQAGGGFAGPGAAPAAGRGPRFDDLPAFCRVTATLKPSSDSDIKAEFWLPTTNWNGRLQPTAAGVFLGSINYVGMANILRNGSVTATSDNGHEGGSGDFALGHPEKLKDFAYRAGHETGADAKMLAKTFYEKGPDITLMNECGGGGRTSLVEVQRYQDDLDLAMVGGLDSDTTHHVLGQMWVWQANHQTGESVIPPEKYSVLTDAALQACDARDGAKDGLIQDPTKCKFDPGVVECKNGDGPDCLTKPQVEAARKIYSPVRNSRTGEYLLGPFMPGSELGWGTMAGAAPFPYAVEVFRYLAFKDPELGLQNAPDQLRFRRRAGGFGRESHHEREELRSIALLRTRRKAVAVGRMERHGDRALDQLRLLQRIDEEHGQQGDERCPPVHGARHGPLPGRQRAQYVRYR